MNASPRTFGWQVFWWTVYAAAFGLTEAALVVYVRKLLGMPPGLDYREIMAQRGGALDVLAFTREFQRNGLLGVELAREAGTILLLLGAAMAGGRTMRERWGVFWYTFAVWDLTYYLWLALAIGFPRGLTAVDVYFLIPITWYGPVWFPVCIVMPLLGWLGLRLMADKPLPRLPFRSRRMPRTILLLVASLLCMPLTARADDALARVRAKGEIVIATDATYPPFEYKDDGNLTGFDVELGTEIGKVIGIKVRFESLEWAGVLASVETGKCDLAMSGVTITEERKKGGLAFSRPYFLSGQVIVRKKGDARIGSAVDLVRGGLTAAVQHDTTGQFALEKKGMPKDRMHRFDALQDALLDVRNGKSDAAVGDLPALAEMIRKGYSAELEILPGGPFVTEYLGIAGRKDSRDLVAAVNRAIEQTLLDGRYAALYQKWMLEPLPLATVAVLAGAADEGTPIPPDIAAQAAAPAPAPGDASAPVPPGGGSALAIRPDVLRQALPVLLRGAVVTLQLTGLTLILGVPLGLLVALVRISGFKPLNAVASVYVEVVRGTPLLMQIYVIYFVLPSIGLSVPPFLAGVMALSLNAAAYVSEIFRAGIESLDIGQREAARALGMTGGQTMWYVLLPQTLRRVLPPLTNEAVALLKDSSLVSVVALTELMRAGKELATNSGAPTTVLLAVALLYLAMTLPLTLLVRYLENRWQPIRRETKARALPNSSSPAK